MREARALVTAELDRVESTLKPGSGKLDLFGITRGNLDSGIVGGGVDYEHRISERMSTFANGLIGHGWGVYEPLTWEAKAGFRLRF